MKNNKTGLYKLKEKDGKHLAESRTTPGYFRGTFLNDKTNKLDGQAEFEPVELSEEEIHAAQAQAVYDFTVFKSAIDYLSPYAKRLAIKLWYDIALPKIRNEYLPKATATIAQIGKRGIETSKEFLDILKNWNEPPKYQKVLAELEEKKKLDSVSVEIQKDELQDNFQKKEGPDLQWVSDEEYQSAIRLAQIHAILLASDIRKLSKMCVNPDLSPQMRIERQQYIEKLTSQDIMNSISLLLEDRYRNVLDEATRYALEEFYSGRIMIGEESVEI